MRSTETAKDDGKIHLPAYHTDSALRSSQESMQNIKIRSKNSSKMRIFMLNNGPLPKMIFK